MNTIDSKPAKPNRHPGATGASGVKSRPITSYIFPPIQDRRFDWCAYFDPEHIYGYGRTEQEAIADLMEQVE